MSMEANEENIWCVIGKGAPAPYRFRTDGLKQPWIAATAVRTDGDTRPYFEVFYLDPRQIQHHQLKLPARRRYGLALRREDAVRVYEVQLMK